MTLQRAIDDGDVAYASCAKRRDAHSATAQEQIPHRKFVSRGIALNTALGTRYYEKALPLEDMSGDVLTIPKSRCITFHGLSQPRPSEELICTSPELIYNPVT